MRKATIVLVGSMLLCFVKAANSQTLTFTFQNGQNIAGPKFQYEVWVKSSDGTSKMGSVIVYNNYSTQGFGGNIVANGKVTVIKNASVFGGTYGLNAANDNTSSRFAYSWTYLGGTGNGVVIPSTGNGVLAFTIQIAISNQSKTSGLSFQGSLMTGQQYFDDEINTWPTLVTTSTLDSPLPIQLAQFSATQIAGNQVRLSWNTVTETNNFGFEIQKSLDANKDYQTIPGSFVKGAGTTIQPQSYSYAITNTDGKSWYYRLKQMDLDGSVTYSDGILAGASLKPIPATMALDQNYPNPFNPTTTIDFALPKDQMVTLEVFNILGQRVALLADGFKEAGYYSMPFDARELSSGLYFYRLVTKEQTFLKKMMVVK